MSADISRQRFDPKNDFSGVLMQQGRVLLDADWNEWLELLDRRLRAETTDIIGRGIVPKETPLGFKIGLIDKKLTIGPGRIYVDGLLAENHGKAPEEFDSVLGELRGTASLPYDEQPYLPDANNVAPPPQEGGPHLVYVDVWQREVTFLERPDLVENAVGVDTTARLQTVWQVRVLSNVGADATCATPIPAWSDLIQPSAGRLTTDTATVPSLDDPCLIPPGGGYRGLENRLYRIEIHDQGPLGTATFKWARHNASVASAVTTINGEDLTMERLGRDADLRFKAGDWVEITDDLREFSGKPGEMRKIKIVTDASRTITIDGALPADFPADPATHNTTPARHTRIRRWDQKGQIKDTDGNVLVDLALASSSGVIPVSGPGVNVILEDGIQISFTIDPAGGQFRVADHWTFAARTADASVEKLNAAPPRGVHHHYCRLAMVTFPASVTDCRVLWPPEFGGEDCACSVCVTADTHNKGTLTIQQGIDQVKETGGTVCLGPGVYNLGEAPILVEGARAVTLRGQGWTTILAHFGDGSAIKVQNCLGFTMEQLMVVTLGVGNDESPAVAVQNSVGVTLQQDYFIQAGEGEQPRAAIGLGGFLIETCLRENVVLAPLGVANLPGSKPNTPSDNPRGGPLLTFGLICRGNDLLCSHRGISLEGLCVHEQETCFADNFINEAAEGGIVVTGAVIGAAFGGSHLDVVGNTLRVSGDGIVLGTDDARINDNDIGPAAEGKGGDGVALVPGLTNAPINRCQIIGNRISRVAGDGIALRAAVGSAMIKQNMIDAVSGGGIVMQGDSSADNLSIENNQVFEVAHAGATVDERAPVAGIQLIRVRQADVSNNTIEGVGRMAAFTQNVAGIQIVSSSTVRIAGNRVIGIGVETMPFPPAAGIDVLGAFARLDIAANTVRRSQEPSANDTTDALWWALRIGRREHANLFTFGSHIIALNVTTELVFSVNTVVLQQRPRESVAVRGNILEAFGRSPAVEINTPGSCLFNDNHCRLEPESSVPALVIEAGGIIACSNFLDGPHRDTMARLLTGNGPFTIVGNIGNGPIFTSAGPLAPPWKPLNIVPP